MQEADGRDDSCCLSSNIVDRLNVIPQQHGTHDKVWDMTTITSLRKVEVEEEVEEKVEVEVEVWMSRRRRKKGGDKGGT